MANINISMVGIDVSFSLSDQDAQRILAAHTAMLAAQQPNEPTPTPQDVVLNLAQRLVTALAESAVKYERDAATAAAAASVAPIPATLQP